MGILLTFAILGAVYVAICFIPVILPYYAARVLFKTLLKLKWDETKKPAKIIQPMAFGVFIINCLITQSNTDHHYFYQIQFWDFILQKHYLYIPISYALSTIVFILLLRIKFKYMNQLFKYSVVIYILLVPYWIFIMYAYLFCLTIMMGCPPMK